MLALFGLGTRNLRLYVPPSPEREALRALRKRRDEIDGLVRMEKNRLERAHLPRVLRSSRGSIRRLEREKAALEDEIEALIASAPDLARKAQLLRSIVGVGQHTTSAVLAYLPEIGTLTKSEAAGPIGTAPVTNESGQHRGRRRLQGGRACVRDSLYMAALVARTHNPAIRRFAESLTARGKPPKLVLGAIMRRLAVLMNAVLKTDQPCRLNATA